jgi:hypothetical protein
MTRRKRRTMNLTKRTSMKKTMLMKYCYYCYWLIIETE